MTEIKLTTVGEILRGRMSRAELEAAWALIEPAGDWRAPIVATIDAADFERCAQACEFYTATTLQVVERKPARSCGAVDVVGEFPERLVVAAAGYRQGPAGP